VLPSYRDTHIESAIPAPEVTKIAIRLRYLIEESVPCELDESQITQPHSKVITRKVIQAAKEAGGTEHRACIVYCLLVVKRWFKHQGLIELWDADLHNLRATACEVIAKVMSVMRLRIHYCLAGEGYLTNYITASNPRRIWGT
jgi:hypothetical protein